MGNLGGFNFMGMAADLTDVELENSAGARLTMLALHTAPKSSKFSSSPSLRLASPERRADKGEGRPAMRLQALPVEQTRIARSIDLAIDHLSTHGLAAMSRQPLTPGQILSLAFPDSPFLPRPGTLARVEDCTPTKNGYQLELSYNPPSAA